ncbi:hypothetical protein SFRURICE_020580 [Spodoptera frugiperda]|nr:hypothetical protein SFRURICE_020580 [Spodoptera frugiperda]
MGEKLKCRAGLWTRTRFACTHRAIRPPLMRPSRADTCSGAADYLAGLPGSDSKSRSRKGVFYYPLYFDISSVTLTVNTNQTTPIKLKSIELFRLESGQYSNLAPKMRHFDFFFIFVTLIVNTNPTTPLKPKSIESFRLESEQYSNLAPKIHHFCHSHSKYESNDTSQVKIHQAV